MMLEARNRTKSIAMYFWAVTNLFPIAGKKPTNLGSITRYVDVFGVDESVGIARVWMDLKTQSRKAVGRKTEEAI